MLGIFDDFGSFNPYPVASGGFLLGAQVCLVLFGLHTGQVFRYYHRFGKDDSRWYRYATVPLIFGLSTLHVSLVSVSLYHYFVRGIVQPSVWGYFYWGLSTQDLIIPMISAVAHTFFGYRVWSLWGLRKTWWYCFLGFVSLTLGTGVVFAALARVWAADPWVPYQVFLDKSVGPAADVLPTVWLSCSALIDGSLTASLLYLLLRETKVSMRSRRMLTKVIGLTLETVMVTHIIGGCLFILWLTSRTRTNAFWFFIQIIAETYSLSILFTLNSRTRFRKAGRPDSNEMVERQLEMIHEIELGLRDVSRHHHQQDRGGPRLASIPASDTPTKDGNSMHDESRLRQISSLSSTTAIEATSQRRSSDGSRDQQSSKQSEPMSSSSYADEVSYLPVLGETSSGSASPAGHMPESSTVVQQEQAVRLSSDSSKGKSRRASVMDLDQLVRGLASKAGNAHARDRRKAPLEDEESAGEDMDWFDALK